MSARDDVLGRVRSALRQTPATEMPDASTIDESVGAVGDVDQRMVELFAERVEDYRAVVVRCSAGEVAAAVRVGLAHSARVVVPAGFPQQWLADLEAVELVRDDAQLSAPELDAVDAVVSTAALGIAVTGTIVLDHGSGQGRRALSLVPDRHVCVVLEDQVVADVPDAVRRVDPVRPLTWISGPSATSDIELSRVEGVHGPRNLHVIVVAGEPLDLQSSHSTVAVAGAETLDSQSSHSTLEPLDCRRSRSRAT